MYVLSMKHLTRKRYIVSVCPYDSRTASRTIKRILMKFGTTAYTRSCHLNLISITIGPIYPLTFHEALCNRTFFSRLAHHTKKKKTALRSTTLM